MILRDIMRSDGARPLSFVFLGGSIIRGEVGGTVVAHGHDGRHRGRARGVVVAASAEDGSIGRRIGRERRRGTDADGAGRRGFRVLMMLQSDRRRQRWCRCDDAFVIEVMKRVASSLLLLLLRSRVIVADQGGRHDLMSGHSHRLGHIERQERPGADRGSAAARAGRGGAHRVGTRAPHNGRGGRLGLLRLLLQPRLDAGLPVPLAVVHEPVGELLHLDARVGHDLGLLLLSRIRVRHVLRAHHPRLEILDGLGWEARRLLLALRGLIRGRGE
mmetsp:Transcript_4985/g.14305  ORF Transcript_4985/g.14305 Transcript_4985/m.14305 type:complete len:273 (-) Transcript_4985:971-1789(-)